jgi:sulfotransferase
MIFMKNLFFLSGLPRSGSTLLGSILNQNPDIYCTPTSPLSDLLVMIDQSFDQLDFQYTYEKEEITKNTYKALLANFYDHVDKPYIFDKHRAWPRNLGAVERFTTTVPKVIATTRRISEILASYISLIEKNNNSDNFVDNHLRSIGKEITLDNRVEILWKNYVSDPYSGLVYGLNHHHNNIHLIDYNDLTDNPEEELFKIYQFLEIPSYEHRFSHIKNTCAESKDSAWGLDHLHDIRSSLGRTNKSPEKIIGEYNTKLYDSFNI